MDCKERKTATNMQPGKNDKKYKQIHFKNI